MPQVRHMLATANRVDDDAEDDDPIFLPQDAFEAHGANPYRKIVGGLGEERSDIFEERLARAAELKDAANAKLNAGEYAAARHAYRQAYYHVDYNEIQASSAFHQ